MHPVVLRISYQTKTQWVRRKGNIAVQYVEDQPFYAWFVIELASSNLNLKRTCSASPKNVTQRQKDSRFPRMMTSSSLRVESRVKKYPHSRFALYRREMTPSYAIDKERILLC